MASEYYADVVATIPYGHGQKRFVKVGALLKMENNDASRGPGFVIMMDKHFNPAGVPTIGGDGSSIALSLYWPKPKEDRPRTDRNLSIPPSGEFDDDIPF